MDTPPETPLTPDELTAALRLQGELRARLDRILERPAVPEWFRDTILPDNQE